MLLQLLVRSSAALRGNSLFARSIVSQVFGAPCTQANCRPQNPGADSPQARIHACEATVAPKAAWRCQLCCSLAIMRLWLTAVFDRDIALIVLLMKILMRKL